MAREFSEPIVYRNNYTKKLPASSIMSLSTAPEIGMVTVSGVEVSRDLAYAKVYVTFLEMDEAKNRASMKLLDEGKSFVRGLLGRRVKMRNTPSLRFIQDSSITEGMRISNLVSQVRREDAKKSGNTEDPSPQPEDE